MKNKIGVVFWNAKRIQTFLFVSKMVHFYIITSFKRAFLSIGIENFPLLDESEGFERLYIAGFVYLPYRSLVCARMPAFHRKWKAAVTLESLQFWIFSGLSRPLSSVGSAIKDDLREWFNFANLFCTFAIIQPVPLLTYLETTFTISSTDSKNCYFERPSVYTICVSALT